MIELYAVNYGASIEYILQMPQGNVASLNSYHATALEHKLFESFKSEEQPRRIDGLKRVRVFRNGDTCWDKNRKIYLVRSGEVITPGFNSIRPLAENPEHYMGCLDRQCYLIKLFSI